MPLPERVIQPVNVSRGTLQYQVPDELEGVTNGTLSNIIRQLSSLSRHAEEIFGNLFRDAENVASRSSNLQAKIDRLAIRVTQLDSTVEEVSLQDIQLRKAFRSSQAFDQQVVSRETMPKAMLEVYLGCDKPPPLDKLNPYREDGKDGLKFYTDPTYFFELWRQEMLKDTERMMHDRVKKHPTKTGGGNSNLKSDANNSGGGGLRHKKRVRQPHNTAERQRQKALGRGEVIMMQHDSHETSFPEHQLNEMYQDEMFNSHQMPPAQYNNNAMMRPNSIELKRAYEQQQQQQQQQLQQQRPPDLMRHQQQQHPFGNGHLSNNYNNNESIYTPRVLLANNQDQPPSPRYYPSSSNHSNGQMFQHPDGMTVPFGDPGRANFDISAALSEQLDILNFQREGSPMGSGAGTPSRGGQRRPSQPPPAPPPLTSSNAGTPTRASSVQRDSLPPPPPPPPPSGDLQNGFMSPQHQQNQIQMTSIPGSSSDHVTVINSHFDADLPPPPPVPESNSSSLGIKIPVEHLPPSPPPPPPMEPPAGVIPAPPPPPPPPPADGLFNGSRITNGDATDKKGKTSPIKTESSTASSPPKSVISPVVLKKPAQPAHLVIQDGVRSDLLKAIRDGIALKKVEEREKAKNDEKSANGQTDVASILARRVAVEMSDSDDGNANSDSEYDSDDWDESTA